MLSFWGRSCDFWQGDLRKPDNRWILSRDLKRNMKNGSHEIVRIIPFDLFPGTQHIETLRRKAPA